MPAALPEQAAISQASQGKVEFRISEMRYGNGYSQRTPDGINAVIEMWDVAWENITSTEFNNIVAALDTAKGVDYFIWTPPGSSSSKKFIAKSYTKSVMSGDVYSVSASLEQVFDV